MIQSPKPPQCSSLSPWEKDLVDKLQRLKEPLQCAFYFSLNTKISPLHVPNSKQVVEVAGGVEKRKQFVTSTPEQRKNQRVLVENSPTPTPPHLCGFEGDGAGLPSCVQGHALDSNGLISHSMGHMDLCSFLQGLFQQGIMGVKLFVEKMEVIRKQVSELESELNEERSVRKKAEGKVAEMEKELARCEGEPASARRDCEALMKSSKS
ncbi:uncharacterized protein LOC107629602 [Arachis ipaensis]|uniref:uncharacterized protein LOC107629602 n=1 Tax=Arachis ipaensis TaxID=130454 RepID=UPI0007AFE02D|nr:uncharacterized protein LOC107629602 [Arachis ipaensis]XP_025642679.1 uncharacterized protein LOC112737122 [Arachis hypogaea]QHN99490.1 uncharacterized protein DS421_13g398270 [Arachis hypogaea]